MGNILVSVIRVDLISLFLPAFHGSLRVAYFLFAFAFDHGSLHVDDRDSGEHTHTVPLLEVFAELLILVGDGKAVHLILLVLLDSHEVALKGRLISVKRHKDDLELSLFLGVQFVHGRLDLLVEKAAGRGPVGTEVDTNELGVAKGFQGLDFLVGSAEFSSENVGKTFFFQFFGHTYFDFNNYK